MHVVPIEENLKKLKKSLINLNHFNVSIINLDQWKLSSIASMKYCNRATYKFDWKQFGIIKMPNDA